MLFMYKMCLFIEKYGKPSMDDHELPLWLLLKGTQSTDKRVRWEAVQNLAGIHYWHGTGLFSTLNTN